ncbi:helix-turn-helix domain-containing protein [Streptomyces sp. HUCO-GS316]|jgi:transcriptional regulator with XRE-family HTH domain|uniref:helix-turn-helix domain-containing protein n=1 Tax=Streptomyces sp. HUCO-GS316 TaxID=2692198 RepID=UPI001367C27B|nr:pyridoxamine 5'-phosphate oxidase family protein [Streptomyces sp. HUCO-GS316]MXM68016.1 helix-turn-helix domain-containing protein [Streptomyces sp. HUCO-GS316]
MNEPAPPNGPNTPDGPPLGDLGRRLAQRRTDLGLTRRETAARAGMAPSYLRHLEEHPSAAPDASVLRRLAGALETTVTALAGGDADLPPGQGRAGRHPRFTELGVRECRALLASHGVGRLAVSTASGPVVVPVNYSVVDGAVVFRTAPGATPSQALDCQVAFEVDRVDDTLSQGWSVLLRGRARAVTDPDAVRLLEEHAYSSPWAGGERDLWLRIDPVVLTGRRIAV